MSRRQRRPPEARTPQPKPSTTGISTVEKILLALLVLVPVVFSRWTEDAFDFPKGALLTTGALLLVGWGLATELTRLARLGVGAGMGSARTRFASWMRRDPLGVSLLLFVLSSAVSTLTSQNPGIGVFGARGSYAGLLVACAATTVYFASRSLGAPIALLRRLAMAAGIAAVIAAAYGLVQFTGHDPLEWGLVAFLNGMMRIPGTMGQPNLLAGYLVMIVPLVVWLAARGRTFMERLVWCAVGVLAIVVIGLTLSRASWVALAGSGVVGMLLYFRSQPSGWNVFRGRRAILVAATLVVVIVASAFALARTSVGAHLVARARDVASLRESGNASRIQTWRAAFQMVARKPLFGVGTNQFGLEFTAYRTPSHYRLEAGGVAATAHNVAVDTLANQGAFGALAAVLVLVFTIVAVGRALRHPTPAVAIGVVAAATALSGFLLWDLVNYTVAGMAALVAVLAGWISAAAADRDRTSDRVAPRARTRPATWSVIISSILVALAFIPLVFNPWRAQALQLAATAAPANSARRAKALMRASTLAPWNGWNPHHLATMYEAAAVADPDSSRKIGILRLALEAETKASRAEPHNGQFRARCGMLLNQLLRLGAPDVRIDDVRAAFQQAMAHDPANPNIMDEAAQVMIGLRQYPEARVIALRNIESFPEFANPLGQVGLMALREHRVADAADTLERALTRDWRGDRAALARAQGNLSEAYLALGRFQDAHAMAESALQNDPQLDAAKSNRDAAARLLATQGAGP